MNPSSQATPELTSARSRLDRLENFLREDPNNPALLLDAFETALRCGEFERAEFHLRHGLALDADPWGWRLREGDLLLAQRRPDHARLALEALSHATDAPAELAPVLQHNLAYIDLLQGAHAQGVARLAPLMERQDSAPSESPVLAQALQVLWLRLLHRNGELERARDWAQTTEGAGQLRPAAAGVASLIALDLMDFATARRWAQWALSQAMEREQPLEALNTLASLELGDTRVAQARELALAALQINPQDGRSWSVLAYTELLTGDMDKAEANFDRAVTYMPDHTGTRIGLGWTQLLQHRISDARATFEQALAMDRNFADSHGCMAVVQAMQEQHHEAQESIRRALGLDKYCLSAEFAQGILDGETQDPAHFQQLMLRLLGQRESDLGGTLLDRLRMFKPPPA